MDVFDKSVFTPNDQFFVRWHWADIPTSIDVESFRLNVFGHVNRPLSISLAQLLRLPRVEMAAVNQCSGNSRGLFQPRVAGAQWGNGAMGNAKWLGVRLRDVLEERGIVGSIFCAPATSRNRAMVRLTLNASLTDAELDHVELAAREAAPLLRPWDWPIARRARTRSGA